MPRWQTADLPAAGVWRVGRGDDPLSTATPVGADLGDSRVGNRFDSLTGAFRVLYFGTDLEACFGETLSRFRADPKLAFIDEEWEANRFMARGAVPKDWRMRRTAVRVLIKTDRRFLDVEALGTRKRLQRLLGPVLALFEVEDLDVAAIRGPDRRVTRLIAEWAWRQVDERGERAFAGLRYLSRIETGWECWAVFDDVDIEELERHPILETTPELLTVAEAYGLRVF
ncbi:MAG: RES family NAD+ phosphorylase [Acidimicrobiales bacterium]